MSKISVDLSGRPHMRKVMKGNRQICGRHPFQETSKHFDLQQKNLIWSLITMMFRKGTAITKTSRRSGIMWSIITVYKVVSDFLYMQYKHVESYSLHTIIIYNTQWKNNNVAQLLPLSLHTLRRQEILVDEPWIWEFPGQKAWWTMPFWKSR